MTMAILKFFRCTFWLFGTVVFLDTAWHCFTATTWPADARIGPELVGTLCLIGAAFGVAFAFGFLDDDRSEA